MANSLFPAFVRINYHSPFAPHIMTVPTLAWNDINFPTGEFDTHNAGVTEADAMIEELTDGLLPIFNNQVTIDSWEIWTMASAVAAPIFRLGGAINDVGVNISTSWYKAVQQTFSFRTSLAGIFKFVLLDVPTGNNFDRSAAITPPYDVPLGVLMSEGNGWAGRDGGRPQHFLQVAETLNEKLRREYRMT